MLKAILESKELSLGAKALWMLALQLKLNADKIGIYLTKEQMEERCAEGSHAFDTKWKELLNKGYMRKERDASHYIYKFYYKDENGAFVEVVING